MKPGYQTTEFWLGAVYTALNLINQSGFIGKPLDIGAIMAIAAPVITYIVTRSAAKAFAQFVGAKPVDPKTLND